MQGDLFAKLEFLCDGVCSRFTAGLAEQFLSVER
jgi:hypothetical protein